MKYAICLFLVLILLACTSSSPPETGLRELSDFGDNPGDLRAFLYEPAERGQGALVVVLHGCGQDAEEMAALTGWNDLAERHGFLVLYPEQRWGNNIQTCFNWFDPEDTGITGGETESVIQMVRHLAGEYGLDPARIFVTGMSAGAAMGAALLAAYPRVFTAGAFLSGVPAGAAENLAEGLAAMQGKIDRTPDDWRQLVAGQNPGYAGPYPRVMIVHGADDAVVSPLNARELAEQWTALHGLSPDAAQVTPRFEGNPLVTQTSWADSTARIPVVSYRVEGLGHAIAVDPGEGPRQGGTTGRFAKDVDFFSTWWISRFFGLIQG